MQLRLLLLILALMLGSYANFVLDEIAMDQETLEACSHCDSRSELIFTQELAKEVKDYLKRNHVKIAIESGDVMVKRTEPNQQLDTGHSCSRTAELRDIKVEAKMTYKKDYLESTYAFDTAITVGKVPHKVEVSANVRTRLGAKIFGSCKRYARKTCGPVKATSSGTNQIEVTVFASEVQPFTRAGKQYIQFRLNVQLEEKPELRTYSPATVSVPSCRIFGVVSLKSKIRSAASKYVNTKSYKLKMTQVSSALVGRLKAALGVGSGTLIEVPVKVTGGSGRKKRSIVTGCQFKKCPPSFNRIGNTKICRRYFGLRQPSNCKSYASAAVLRYFPIKISGRTRKYYYCQAPMIPK